MNRADLHHRLLPDLLAVGDVHPLVLTGGYAVQAHGLVNRLSQDLDVATQNPEPMEKIAATVSAGWKHTAGAYELRRPIRCPHG